MLQEEDQDGAGGEEGRGKAEGDAYSEGGPDGADDKAREEIARGIDCGERTECHAVLFAGDEFGGDGVFEGFFGADVEAGDGGDEEEESERVGAGTEKKSRDDA